MSKHSSLGYGIILTLLAYASFATCSALVRGINQGLPTIEIIFFQSTICLLFLLPSLYYKKGLAKLKPVAIFPHLIRDISGASSYFFYFLAIKYLGLIDATVLSYTAPFYIPFFWKIWAKEPIPKEIFWAISLGFLGIILILKPGASIFSLYSWIGIFSGMLSALALTGVSMLHKKKERVENVLFYMFLTSTAISTPLVIISWKNPDFTQLFLLLGIGFFTFVGQILLTKAYKYGSASYLSPISYSAIIYTSFISYLFFNTPPGWINFIGSICVIAGGTLTYLLEKKPKNLAEALEANPFPRKPWWKFWKK